MDKSFLSKISAAHLRRAADLREKIEGMEKELAQLLGIPEQLTLGSVMKKKRAMSAAARKKISEAAKARWAKIRARK